MAQLEVKEEALDSQRRQIAIVGELDLAVADKVDAVLSRASDCELVLLDLRQCEFIDSTGIAVFVHAYNQRREAGHRLAIFGANRQVLRILEVTGLTRDGLVFPSAEEAIRG